MKPEGISTYQWWLYNYYFVTGNYLGESVTKNYFDPKKLKLFEQIGHNKGIEHRGGLIPTETIEVNDLTPYLNGEKDLAIQPLLFRGKAKSWPCTSKWTEQFFKDQMGNAKTDIIDNEGLAEPGTEFIETDMAGFIKKMKQDKSAYLRFSRIIDDHPELKNDLDTDFIYSFKSGPTRGDTFYLFMGEAGTKTDMHHAMPATVFVQVRGQKKWTIYAPEERIFLNPVAKRMPYQFSKANPYITDSPDFPIQKYAKYYQFTMNEGDVMWLPPFFWHYVENPTYSIGVAFKYVDLVMAAKLSKICLWLYMTSTNPSIFSSFIHNKRYKHDLLYEQKKKKKKEAMV